MAKAVEASEENSSFATKLASTDKKVRERGVVALTKWLTSRASVSDEELKKIWKGLFYCVWHADKAPVQAELAEHLAGILPALPRAMGLQFFKSFLLTMRREWAGIDRLRMDKFYLLLRKFLQAVLELLHKEGWEPGVVEQFMGVLRDGTLLSQDKHPALGINLHLADIFVEEVKGCKGVTNSSTPALLLEPWIATLAGSSEKLLLGRVQETVFENLLREHSDGGGSTVALCDLPALANRIFTLASEYDTPDKNRKVLYDIHAEFQKVVKSTALEPAAAAPVDSEVEEPEVQPANGVNGKKVKAKKKAKGLKRKGAAELAPAESAEGPEAVGNGVEAGEGESAAKRRRQSAGSTPAELGGVSSAEEAEGAPEGEQEEQVDVGEVAANLSEKFAAISEVAQGGRKRKKRKAAKSPVVKVAVEAAQEAAKVLEEVAIGQEQKGVKKLKVSVNTEDSPAAAEKQNRKQSESSSAKKKKVRFSLKNNIAFKHGGPVPDPALRTPPSARPRGSALKKTPSPRPHLPRGNAVGVIGERRKGKGKGAVALSNGGYVLASPSKRVVKVGKGGKQALQKKQSPMKLHLR